MNIREIFYSYKETAVIESPPLYKLLFIGLHTPSYFFWSIYLAIKISAMASRPESDDGNDSLGKFIYRPETRFPGVFPDDRDIGAYADRQLLLYLLLQAVTDGIVSARRP